ncbi:MAG: hypothetical protein PF569_09145 [Candidatus Woesearchaeota archaeon]|nr:hypothetical protein [Candidatus Woesearchaeota archaeon]
MTRITLGTYFDLENFDEVLNVRYIHLLVFKVKVCKLQKESGFIYKTIDIYR